MAKTNIRKIDKKIETRFNKPKVGIALVHYPVYDNKKNIITSAITCLTIHDLARLCATYKIEDFFVINPMHSQKELVKKIIYFWEEGEGLGFKEARTLSLKTVKVVDSILDSALYIKNKYKKYPKLVATSSKYFQDTCLISFLRKQIFKKRDYFLILFGTAWGLTHDIIMDCDYILEPIARYSNFRNLSVRSAASIIIDNLLRP